MTPLDRACEAAWGTNDGYGVGPAFTWEEADPLDRRGMQNVVLAALRVIADDLRARLADDARTAGDALLLADDIGDILDAYTGGQ